MSVLAKIVAESAKALARKMSSRLRRIALNLLKNEKSSKRGIKIKQQKAGWSEAYLEKVLKI